MTYTIVVKEQRLAHLDANGVKYSITEYNGDSRTIDITINSGLDLLEVFHAGVSAGHELSLKLLNNSHKNTSHD